MKNKEQIIERGLRVAERERERPREIDKMKMKGYKRKKGRK